MNSEQNIQHNAVAITDNGQTADAFVALGGTGGAFIFLLGAYILLAPAAIMMAMH